MNDDAQYGTDPTPDLDDVLQEEAETLPVPPVPVAVAGPVQVQTLPVRTTSMRSLPIDALETIAAQDPRRAQVVLYATTATAAFFVGTDRQMVESGQAARFDPGIQVILRSTDRLYARSAIPGTVCRLTVIIDNWAD